MFGVIYLGVTNNTLWCSVLFFSVLENFRCYFQKKCLYHQRDIEDPFFLKADSTIEINMEEVPAENHHSTNIMILLSN